MRNIKERKVKLTHPICVRCNIYGKDLPGIPSNIDEYIESLITPIMEDKSILWCRPHWIEHMDSMYEMLNAVLKGTMDEYLDELFPKEGRLWK